MVHKEQPMKAPDSPTTISISEGTSPAFQKSPDDSLLVNKDLTQAFASAFENDPSNVSGDDNVLDGSGMESTDFNLQKDTSPMNTTHVTVESDDNSSSSGSGAGSESLRFYGRNSDDGSNFDDGVDSELDAAVLNAIQSTDSRLDDDSSVGSDATSVASNAYSVSSVKSAVQVRLESRRKNSTPSQETFDAKIEAANQRKLFFLQGIASKGQARLDKVASARTLVERQHDAELMARKKSLEQKQTQAFNRKEYFLVSKMAQLNSKNTKASLMKEVLGQQKDAEVDAIREKMDAKLREAAEKKEFARLKFSEKVQAKFAKISDTKESTKQSLKEMSDKISEKIIAANTRKSLIDSESMEKISGRLSKKQEQALYLQEADDASVSSRKQELDEKYARAAERKQALIDARKAKISGHLSKKQEQALYVQESDDASVSSRKQELDEKYARAAERKHALIEARKAKVNAYLSQTFTRGQEAIKRKEEMSLSGADMIITNASSLSSIQEDMEADSAGLAITDSALGWLDDENSVASMSSSASSKSRVQRRLESYKKKTASKSNIAEKLQAAERRREMTISATQERAGFSAKMDKVSLKMQVAESKISELSIKLGEKMKAHSDRKSKHMEVSIRGKTVAKNMKIEEARGKQVEKDAKVTALQEKLESKLLAALERKESIVAAKVAKASGDISVSSARGKSAVERKEAMMLKIMKKSESKMDSASKRRRQLRALEKKKQEVMMVRREMARTMSADDKLVSIQKKLAMKMSSAQERNQRYIDAKKAKAAEYASSISDRGDEIAKERESSEVETKTKLDEKLDAAMKRKAELQAKCDQKNAIAEARRKKAKELAKQRKLERNEISNWEEESVSPSTIENLKSEDLDDVNLDGTGHEDSNMDDAQGEEKNDQKSVGSYEERRLLAKQQLMDEIQLANEAKQDEMVRLSNEIKKSKRPSHIRNRSSSAASVQSFGTIDTNDCLSFEEGEVSISGLSTVREEQGNADRRKAQTALALAELDIKLSEIQIMQAILLAEEASISGKDSFKTVDKSVDDLSSVRGADNLMRQKKSDERRDMLKSRAKNFFDHTIKQAKIAKKRAGNTLVTVKRNIEKHEKRPKNIARPSTAPSSTFV